VKIFGHYQEKNKVNESETTYKIATRICNVTYEIMECAEVKEDLNNPFKA
jgi:hypothetical protein